MHVDDDQDEPRHLTPVGQKSRLSKTTMGWHILPYVEVHHLNLANLLVICIEDASICSYHNNWWVCEIACTIWNILKRLWLYWTMTKWVFDLFACCCIAKNTWNTIVWKMEPLCFLWCFWREMNDRCFEIHLKEVFVLLWLLVLQLLTYI